MEIEWCQTSIVIGKLINFVRKSNQKLDKIKIKNNNNCIVYTLYIEAYICVMCIYMLYAIFVNDNEWTDAKRIPDEIFKSSPRLGRRNSI